MNCNEQFFFNQSAIRTQIRDCEIDLLKESITSTQYYLNSTHCEFYYKYEEQCNNIQNKNIIMTKCFIYLDI